MISRLVPGLLILIPVCALAQSGERADSEAAALQSWSVDELCGARENSEAWDELERREVFKSRELRSIRQEKISEGMSEAALLCIKGYPESVIPVDGWSSSVTFDVYIYPAAAGEALAVFVGHDKEGTSVVHVAAGDPELVSQAVASTALSCGSSDSARHCYVVDPAQGARLDPCGFPEFSGNIPGSAASSIGGGPGARCGSN